MNISQCPRCLAIETRYAVCQVCGQLIEANVVNPPAWFASSASSKATAAAATSAIKDGTEGTITLPNGHKRHAQYLKGSFTGGLFLNYKTPRGHWHRATAADEATFTPARKDA